MAFPFFLLGALGKYLTRTCLNLIVVWGGGTYSIVQRGRCRFAAGGGLRLLGAFLGEGVCAYYM